MGAGGDQARIDPRVVEELRYLLTLAPAEVRVEVGAFLGVGLGEPTDPDGEQGQVDWRLATTSHLLPWGAARWWMLREDSPELNRMLRERQRLSPGVVADVRDGLPFGPGRTAPLPVLPRRGRFLEREPVPRPAEELIARLRAARGSRTLNGARVAAGELRRADWPLVVAAHAAEPLPGRARWALAEQFECPAELRAAFGTHSVYERRLRETGVTTTCAELVERQGPAHTTLRVLGAGRWLFPTELAPVEGELRPLVERHLGDRPEAWAAAARMLPVYRGTVGALLATAGAARPGEAVVATPPVPPVPVQEPATAASRRGGLLGWLFGAA
ncbi:hypothetical protein [Kitasatospora sp. NPDC004289]